MMNKLKFNEVSLVYTRPPLTSTPHVDGSQKASDLFRSCYPEGSLDLKEFFYVMYLNHGNRMLAISRVSEGGITCTMVDVRIIFQNALLLNATNMILCHNHPSGNPKPSNIDIQLTKSINTAGKTLEIKVLDHIILTSESYYSFVDNGVL